MLNQTESDRLQTYHALNGIRVANINIYICESAQFVSRLKTLGGILICTLWSRFGFSILNLKCSTRKKHHLIILFIGSDPFCTPAVHLHKLHIWFDYIKRTKAGRAGGCSLILNFKSTDIRAAVPGTVTSHSDMQPGDLYEILSTIFFTDKITFSPNKNVLKSLLAP